MKIQAIEELLISHKRTNLQKQLFPLKAISLLWQSYNYYPFKPLTWRWL